MTRQLSLIAGLMLSAGCSGKLDWKGLHTAEGRFNALIPGEALKETTGGTEPRTTYKVNLGFTYYEISYKDLLPNKPQLTLEEFKEYWQSKNYTVTATKAWTIEGAEGWELEAQSNEHKNSYYAGRVIVLGNRMYEVKVVGANARLTASNVRTFLDTFKPYK